ncbi:MAG: heparinase II/III family protein [Armatimonadota bacterium]
MSNQPSAASPEMIDVARELCARINWERPELAQLYDKDVLVAAGGFIRHLRAREVPRPGYTKEYVSRLRASVTPEETAAARERWEAALRDDLLMPYHGNALAALGAETILIAATPDLCRRSAARAMEYRGRWREGFFGVTDSIIDVIRYLFPLEECADIDLLPMLGWLLAKADIEWSEARAWSETTLGTSGHNWWAHTFKGFFLIGLLLPEIQGLERFRVLAEDYFERELSILFTDDGWTKEGSPGYQEFALGSLLGIAHMAELNGIILPERVRERLRTIVDAGWRLLAPDGEFPVFSDFVRASAYMGFHGSGLPESHPCMILRRRAARFSLSEAKYVAEALQPEWRAPYGAILPDEGEDMLAAYRRLIPVAPAGTETSLPGGGFYVMRQDWTPRADYAAIIAGSLGSRVTSHRHADLFSFELYARGRRILVDNWYGPPIEERDNDAVRMWRVSTAAHNTVTIDGQDQVPITGEFSYGGVTIPTVDDWRSAPDYAYFSGVHEGYLRLPSPVTGARRKLFYLRGGYWILLDRFTAPGEAEHEYGLHFHLKVPSTLRDDGSVLTTGEGGNLLILPVPGACGTPTLEPNPYPVERYENPDHLCYTHRQQGNILLATLLVPFTGVEPPAVKVRLLDVAGDERIFDPWEVTGLEITVDGRRDIYVDQHMQWNLPWTCGGYTGSGRVFHSECQ